jgi:hypothetical protein
MNLTILEHFGKSLMNQRKEVCVQTLGRANKLSMLDGIYSLYDPTFRNPLFDMT